MSTLVHYIRKAIDYLKAKDLGTFLEKQEKDKEGKERPWTDICRSSPDGYSDMYRRDIAPSKVIG